MKRISWMIRVSRKLGICLNHYCNENVLCVIFSSFTYDIIAKFKSSVIVVFNILSPPSYFSYFLELYQEKGDFSSQTHTEQDVNK